VSKKGDSNCHEEGVWGDRGLLGHGGREKKKKSWPENKKKKKHQKNQKQKKKKKTKKKKKKEKKKKTPQKELCWKAKQKDLHLKPKTPGVLQKAAGGRTSTHG